MQKNTKILHLHMSCICSKSGFFLLLLIFHLTPSVRGGEIRPASRRWLAAVRKGWTTATRSATSTCKRRLCVRNSETLRHCRPSVADPPLSRGGGATGCGAPVAAGLPRRGTNHWPWPLQRQINVVATARAEERHYRKSIFALCQRT